MLGRMGRDSDVHQTSDGDELKLSTNPKFLTLSDKNDNSHIIESLVGILHKGGIVAVPTDTVYGVACLAQSTEAVEKLYSIKSRNPLKPIAICVGESYDVCQWVRFPEGLINNVAEIAEQRDKNVIAPQSSHNSAIALQPLLDDLLPGPVTIVSERSPTLNSHLNAKTSLVGIRVPDNEFIRSLANRLREPLALTSANISGEETALTIDGFKKMWSSLDAVVDGGEVGAKYIDKQLKYAREGSTVFKFMDDGCSFKVIRAGCAYEETVKILQGKWKLKLDV